MSIEVLQGSTNLIFACTDFRARNGSVRTFVHAKLRLHKTVTVGANLHRLIYNFSNFHHFFPAYFAIS